MTVATARRARSPRWLPFVSDLAAIVVAAILVTVGALRLPPTLGPLHLVLTAMTIAVLAGVAVIALAAPGVRQRGGIAWAGAALGLYAGVCMPLGELGPYVLYRSTGILAALVTAQLAVAVLLPWPGCEGGHCARILLIGVAYKPAVADGHVHFAINERNEQGAFLNNRQYLAAERRVETDEEFRTRVTADLSRSVKEIVDHGLPAPRLFAYPFSEFENPSDPVLTDILAHTVRSLFDVGMLDENGPAITTPADVAAGDVRRMDVTADVALDQWVDRIERSTSVTPGDSNPLGDFQGWTDANGEPAALTATDNGAVAIDPGPRGWAGLVYSESRTGQWQDYSVRAELGGFSRRGDGTATGLRVLVDTPQQVQVTAFAGGYEVRQGIGDDQRVLFRASLPVAAAYTVQVETRPGNVSVSVAGQRVVRVPLVAGGSEPARGGIELTGQRESATAPVPHVKDLTVAEL